MRPKRLFIQFRNQSLNALLAQDKKVLSFESFSLRELSRETLVARLKNFSEGKPLETVLIFPREELLSQEFDVSGAVADLKKSLHEMLENAFPYRIEELSYGVRILERAGERVKGTLTATTHEKLKQWIEPIEQAGLVLNEIVATDEALLSFHAVSQGVKNSILFDMGEDAVECLAVKAGQIRLSKTFLLGMPDFLREIGLATLEFESFEKIYTCGRADLNLIAALKEQFQAPVERLETPSDSRGRQIPAAIYGALFLEPRQYTSLLPVDRKLKKKAGERKKGLWQAAAATFLLAGVLAGLFFVHLKTLEIKSDHIEKELVLLKPEIQSIRIMHETLKTADKRYSSNRESLILFRELALKMPSQVTLTQLGLTEKSLSLQGVSTDNSSIADILALLKGCAGVDAPKLEYTRLRGKEQDKTNVFEFLITAERR